MRNAPMTEANGARKGEAVDSLILAARADVRHTRVLAQEVQAMHDHVVQLLRQPAQVQRRPTASASA